MRVNLENVKTRDMRVGSGYIMDSAEFVPTDNYVLTDQHPTLLLMNPAGAIDVLMPTSNAARKGLTFIIVNLSANTITLKTDGDAAFTAAIAIATTQMSIVVCTGSATQALGWRGHTAAGTQTSP